MGADVSEVYARTASAAASFGADLSAEEMAALAVKNDMGEAELAAVACVFDYLTDKRRQATIETLLKLSRLPQRDPKTFENFDFTRIVGKDVAALRKLPSLANLHARRNIAFIGPGGIGKTHLAQAYGRQCCLNGYKAYYLKATELKDKLARAVKNGDATRVVSMLVKPSCLIIDEVGRCTLDRASTNLFFDIVDRRYEKEVPNTMILTSNTQVNNWEGFFTGDDTLLCALDRVFDRASVFIMRGQSFRGTGLETFTVEAAPQAVKLKS